MTDGQAPLCHLVTGEPLRRVWHCKDRLCPWCCRARSAELREKIEKGIAENFSKARKPAMITLTIDDVQGEPLAHAARRLTEAVNRLRRRRGFADAVAGGVVAIEVTRNRAAETWHVHAHLVVDVEWLAHDELLTLWRQALNAGKNKGGARIERLRRGIAEGLKYVTKGIDATQRLSNDELDELTTWMHGRRLVRTFGNLYKLDLADDDETKVDASEHEDQTHAFNADTGEIKPIRVRCAGTDQWKEAPGLVWHADGEPMGERAKAMASALRKSRDTGPP